MPHDWPDESQSRAAALRAADDELVRRCAAGHRKCRACGDKIEAGVRGDVCSGCAELRDPGELRRYRKLEDYYRDEATGLDRASKVPHWRGILGMMRPKYRKD